MLRFYNFVNKVKQMKTTGSVMAMFLMSWSSLAIGGQTYYVSPQGSDVNNGSLSSPWKSLAFAVTRESGIAPGDTILMRGGTHIMDEVFIARSKDRGGAPGKYLTIKAFSDEIPVMQYSSRRLIIWADYVRIEGLHFIMPWRCDAFGTGIQIVNNLLTGPQPKFGAIETGGVDILIEGNTIEYDDEGGNTQDHGIYVHGGERITVRNNVVIGSKGYGIHLFDEHKSADPAVWQANPFSIKDYVIEGNIVLRSQTRAGMIIAKGRGGQYINLQNIIVRNNVFAGNGTQGLFIREGENISVFNNSFAFNGLNPVFISRPSAAGVDPAKDVSIINNIFVANSEYNHVHSDSPGGNISLDNNLYDSQARLGGVTDARKVIGNPLFVSPDLRDYNLRDGSPAIDAGIDVGLPFEGTAPDLGAYEFDSNTTGIGEPGAVPESFSLFQNYPNPFNPETEIMYEVSTPEHVRILVFDLLGREIRTLLDRKQNIGVHSVTWDGKNDRGAGVASGVYFYRMEVGGVGNNIENAEVRRMILLR